MSSPLLLDHDPASGITEYFHVLEDGKSWAVETRQDVTEIIEVNKALQNDNTGRWGELTQFVQIPLVILLELHKQGICRLDGHALDQERFRKWCNDPANRHFRTKLGRV